MGEILNRREEIHASSLPPNIPASTEFVKPTDKATKTKLGLVKIGDGIEVSSAGVISVSGGGGGGATVIDLGDYTGGEDGHFPDLSSENLAAINAALLAGTLLSFKIKYEADENNYTVHYTSTYIEEVGTETGNEYHYIGIDFTSTIVNIGTVEYDLSTGEPLS